ncbi:hypothetical protein SteCoe_29089 [Stentor coeruleus]|uniref:Uncharacterized protein n=1 Tax=Stentor coeruleus TaxID=5963 RepID=A0A1R2B771_9CILI|nr:hypothetical protein SteCoe_29089 [Stentor coeruleus]
MAEELFTDEIKFPEDLESMLSMSIQYDKLQSIMRFMLDLLKRHEQGLRMAFTKQNVIAPEIITLHSFKESIELRLLSIEKSANKTSNKLEEVKHSLESRGDTVETLKYLLNMITDHNSQVLYCKKTIQELLHEKTAQELRIKNLEDVLKDKGFNDNQKHSLRTIISGKSMESYISDDEKAQTDRNFHSPLDGTDRKAQTFKTPSRRYKARKKDLTNLVLTIPDDPKPEELSQNPQEKNISEISPLFKILNTEKGTDIQSPSINPIAEVKPTFSLTAPNIPAHLQEIFSRIQNIEKALESPRESPEMKTRIGKLESMYKFIEGVLDSCEPMAIRNKDDIMRIARNIKSLETEMANKLNTEDFDAIKSLVIAIASGSPKNDPISLIPMREINMIRMLEKKIAGIELAISDVVKIYPENLEEIMLKLRRIEQKLEGKVSYPDLDDIKKAIDELKDKHRQLSSSVSSREKTQVPQGNKSVESMMFSALNRRISSFEEQFRSLKIPSGIDLTQMWAEIRKISDYAQAANIVIDDLKKQDILRLNSLNSKLDFKADIEQFRILDDKINKKTQEILDKLVSNYADKADVRRGMKYLESLIKNYDWGKMKPEGDDAMLARKPLGGWSCGSCEKKLEMLTGRIAEHSPWRKLPLRFCREKKGNGRF